MSKRVYELTVWDRPQPQRRKKFRTGKDGKPRAYPVSRDVAYVYHIRKAYLDDIRYSGSPEDWQGVAGTVSLMFPRGTDLSMSLIAHVKCPATVSMKRRLAGLAGWPQGNDGDLSNLVKAVEDALQGFAFWNDKQIKMYKPPFWLAYAIDPRTGEDTVPHLYVRLEEL